MTNRNFTEKIAAAQIGIWSDAAKIALETNDVDLFVQHWVEQYLDEGSRPAVERTLGKELTNFIKQQSSNAMNDDTSK